MPISHLIHAAHAVGLHRGYRLTEQDEIEAGEGLDWRMVGNVAVYLLSGLVAQGVVAAWYEAVFIDKGDVPKGHVADDVILHGCGLVLVDAWDMKQEGLASIFTNAHHSSREIYVSKIVLHSWDVLEPVLFCITSTCAFVLAACGIEVVGYLQSDTTSHAVVVAVLAYLNAVRAHLPSFHIGVEDVVDSEIEGHYTNPDDPSTWQPNLHAHIIWDWMNHETGKSFKLGKKDMEELQDMAAETLDMERGQRKAETGREHLEHNDFILFQQKKQSAELDIEIAKKRDKLNTENGNAIKSGMANLFGKGKYAYVGLCKKNESVANNQRLARNMELLFHFTLLS